MGPARSTSDCSLQRLVMAYGLFGFGYVITATFLVAIVRATPATRAIEPVVWVVFGIAAMPSVALWTRLAADTTGPSRFRLDAAVPLPSKRHVRDPERSLDCDRCNERFDADAPTRSGCHRDRSAHAFQVRSVDTLPTKYRLDVHNLELLDLVRTP